MPTQKASTPILRGKDADVLVDSLHCKPTNRSIAAGKELVAKYREVQTSPFSLAEAMAISKAKYGRVYESLSNN